MIRLILKILLGLVVFVAIWHLITVIFQLPNYLLPPPLDVWHAFVTNADHIIENSAVTIQEVLIGFVIANVLSVSIAIAVGFFPRLEGGAVATAVIMKTLPIIALAPLLVLWFGPGVWSKVAAVVVICFFPSLVNVLRGIKSLDASARDLILLYSPTKLQIVRYFILPGVRPYLYSALKVSSSLAVVGALVGEFISANQGLGFMIISGYYAMDVPLVFAVLVVTSAIGLLMYSLIHALESRHQASLRIDS